MATIWHYKCQAVRFVCKELNEGYRLVRRASSTVMRSAREGGTSWRWQDSATQQLAIFGSQEGCVIEGKCLDVWH